MSDVCVIFGSIFYRIGGEWSMKCQISSPQDKWEIFFFTLCIEKGNYLAVSLAWDSRSHLAVTPVHLMKPGIGWDESMMRWEHVVYQARPSLALLFCSFAWYLWTNQCFMEKGNYPSLSLMVPSPGHPGAVDEAWHWLRCILYSG